MTDADRSEEIGRLLAEARADGEAEGYERGRQESRAECDGLREQIRTLEKPKRKLPRIEW